MKNLDGVNLASIVEDARYFLLSKMGLEDTRNLLMSKMGMPKELVTSTINDMSNAQEEYAKKLQWMSNDELLDEAHECQKPDSYDGMFTPMGLFKSRASWEELERRLRLAGFVK